MLLAAAADPSFQYMAMWRLHEDGGYELLPSTSGPPLGAPTPGRSKPGLVYHEGVDRVLLCGGDFWPGTDTWLWDTATRTWTAGTDAPVGGIFGNRMAYGRRIQPSRLSRSRYCRVACSTARVSRRVPPLP
jgi:hypothetical protein